MPREPSQPEAKVPIELDARSLQRVLFNVVFLVFFLIFLSRVAGEVAGPLIFILLASVLAMGLNPIVVALESRWRIPRKWGALLVVAGILLIVMGFLAIILPLFIAQGAHFSETLPKLLSTLQHNFRSLAEEHPLLAPLSHNLPKPDLGKFVGNEGLLGGVLTFASSLVGLIASAAALLIVVLFLLMSPEPIVKGLLSGIPPRNRPLLEKTLIRIGSQLGKWLFAILITSAIKGALVGIGLKLVGFENALLFGLVAGFTNPIPFLGPWIGISLPVLTAVADGHWGMAALAIVVLLISEQLDNSVLSPMILGRTIELHPASMLLGVLVFGTFLGFAGIFLTVPIAIILKALYEEVYLTSLNRPEVSDEQVAQVVAAGQGQKEEKPKLEA
ncbi:MULTISPECIES: AI-2E family transporter [unclassified Meiothermus]|uniref:AI-2E family transporter n=1 Tax=unclassified Meiothermus TaxID=370471 RepID=UPI000D7BBC6C|nr:MULTISPECIES: AI-2E family transporter [unclassified Meiothermus]PZA08857.1 hypothetical protein DNA98_02145 [Meiothermus sp. Pnk-1]RYM36341.1 AI-2E family transporter [Meiothermus sp. PNK-Is4]